MGTKKGSIIKVEPIRDRKKIKDMKEYLRYRRECDYVLFVLGINTGPRISDLLKLKAEDVKDGSLLIREKKNDNSETLITPVLADNIRKCSKI